VSESSEKGQSLAMKWIIVTLIFPVLVLVIHRLLIIPILLLGFLLLRLLGGSARMWGFTVSLLFLLPAAYGAFWICRKIWPHQTAGQISN